MRFDDMIATVLAQQSDGADQRVTQWRQLVDLLAQRRGGRGGGETEQAYAFLRRHRSGVSKAVRRKAARTLAGLAIDPDLVAFFAEDSPAVAAPLIAGARLHTDDWLALLPRMGPSARALLRHRRDLGPRIAQALGAFGASDLVLEAGAARVGVAPEPIAQAESESQISELVERIEAYRRERETIGPPIAEAEPAEGFRWETGAEGIIRWIDGAPRGPLIGQTIASIAGPRQHGVDGQAAGAFGKRAPFRDARLSVAGAGPASGDWRISGVPFFDPARGSFLGYRGTARRPRLDEIAIAAAVSSSGVFGTQFPADSLRQLIHELRTPLNAILGFAEMIEGQYMGPAAGGYRGRAAEIMSQARGLLSAVDDLDTAARIETQRLELADSAVDAVALLGRLHESYEQIAAQNGARLALDIASDLPLARVEAAAAERMLARILAATIGLAEEGETIHARMSLEPHGGQPMLCLSLDRPETIAALEESELLDPGYSPEGDWPGALALGLGFALRLVRNLAEAAGGALLIGDARISLLLPAQVAAKPAKGRGKNGAGP